jgi:endoglucanase
VAYLSCYFFTSKNTKVKKIILHLLFWLCLPMFAFAQSLMLYKAGQNIATPASTNKNMPYEGNEHYQIDYDITGYYAGFGLNLNKTTDFSTFTHIRIAHKGLNAGQYFGLNLRSTGDIPSADARVAPSTTYQVTDIPLSKLLPPCEPFNIKAVTQLVGTVSGVAVSKGSLYIDAIELITKPVSNDPIDDDPQPSLQASATTWKRAKTMGYGINMPVAGDGNLQANQMYTEQDIMNLAQMGVKTIRLAVGFEFLMNKNAPYTLNTSHDAFKFIDKMIAWAIKYDINLILDNHIGLDADAKTPYWTDATYKTDIARIAALWRQITQKYSQTNPEKIFFELKNEPGGDRQKLTNKFFKKIASAVVDTIRKYDTKHTLIIPTSGYSPIDSLIATRPYNDDNIIYTFHNYDPWDFTYQGLTWFVNYNIDIPFPKAGDIAKMDCQYNTAKQWSQKYNVPIYNGEFGASGRSEPASRCNYITNTCAIMDKYDIPGTYWDPVGYYYNFGFFKDGIFEASKGISCFMDALHFTKPTQTIATSKNLYKGGQTEIVSAWVKEGTMVIAETTNDNPFEGGQHYKFDYKSTTGYNGGGLNFHNWWGYTKPPLDFTDGNYTHLRLSYKGLTPRQKLMGQLIYKYLRRENDGVLRDQTKSGTLVEIGTYNADYKTIDIPLESLKNNDLKGFWFVSAISFFLSDPTMAGTVYIDGIELINKNAPPPTPTNKLTVKVADVKVAKGAKIMIPVTTNDVIGNIRGFQFDIKTDKPNVIKLTKITPAKVSSPPFQYNLNLSATEASMVVFSLTEMVSLKANDILFYIETEVIGNVGDMVTLSFEGTNKFNDNIVTPTFEAGKITITNSAVKINGKITHAISNQAINQVKIDMEYSGNTAMTISGASGSYEKEVDANGSSLTIRPSKTGIMMSAIDIDDITATIAIIFGKNKNPYQALAADWNCDKKVDLDDILGIIDFILKGKNNANCMEDWHFAPMNHQFDTPFTHPNFIKLDNVNANSSANFMGIMRGDVDGSINPQAITSTEIRQNANDVALLISNQKMEANQTYIIPIIGKNFDDLKSLQFALKYDQNLLEITNKMVKLPNIYACDTEKAGKVSFLWSNYGEGSISWKGTEPFVSLEVRAKKTIDNLRNVISLDTMALKAKAKNISLQDLKVSFSVATTTPTNDLNSELQHISIYPNPTNGTCMITTTNNTQITMLKLINSMGEVILTKKIDAPQSVVHTTFSDLPIGMYYLQIDTNQGQIIRKLIIAE